MIRGYADDPESCRKAGDRARAALVEEHGAVHRLAAWRALLEELAGEAVDPKPRGSQDA